jgi:hypothetical protein
MPVASWMPEDNFGTCRAFVPERLQHALTVLQWTEKILRLKIAQIHTDSHSDTSFRRSPRAIRGSLRNRP